MVLESTRALPPDSELRMRGVSDRDYFKVATAQKRTAISDVIASRIDIVTPTVVIAAPYPDVHGEVAGVTCGILSLEYFTRLVRQNGSMPELTVTILDQRNRVIIASHAAHRRGLDDLTADPALGSPALVRAGVYGYARARPDGGREDFLVARADVPGTGWHVLVENPLMRLRLQSTRYYAMTLALIALDAVVGDPVRLRQVLVNLVSNALKFTDAGEILVRIVHDLEPDGAQVTLHFSVVDTGIGIPENKQVAIFQAFTQADGSTTRLYGGTGLGLTISWQLVSLMGGHIQVDSTPGRGSAFYFSITVPLASAPIAIKPAPRPVVPVVDARPLRVLVAEDNVVNRRLAEHLLRQRGHQPSMVVNGREAVDALAQRSFDLVLMDLQMPEMDGFEATAAIRAQERETGARTPIVALTAHAMEGDRQRCLDADMDGYVSKPIDATELFAVIDHVSRAA